MDSPRDVRMMLSVLFSLWLGGMTAAQSASIGGVARDETGGLLPGVDVRLSRAGRVVSQTVTTGGGEFRFERLDAGDYQVRLSLVNFATVLRQVTIGGGEAKRLDVAMHLALSATISVTAKSAFTNLADVERPAESLVGVAQSASQGAVTARQLESRPILRSGEILETIPGAIVSQHSGEGKANQYYLRGFNLDHGTDLATTAAGIPVNLPTHAHGQGYTDLNFLIPELVSGVQFSKGPYFADQGDFATAGAANINYAHVLPRPIVRVSGGTEGYGRARVAVSPAAGRGHVLAALEVEHNDGPWTHPDDYRKVNAVMGYSAGGAATGLAITAMAYRGIWNATDQVPERAVASGVIGRFGGLDSTDGGDTYRYGASLEWQRTSGNAITKATAYGLAYDLNLFSNFTYFLDDPVRGDQFHQADHRFVAGGAVMHRRQRRWRGRPVQNTFGLQVRNDDITNIGLYRTQARRVLATIREDSVLET